MENNLVSKEYIIDQYKLAVMDYKTAVNQENKNNALDRMASLENLAMTTHGFAFSDEVHKLSDELRNGK